MKELFRKDFDLGSDASGQAVLGVNAEHLKLELSALYPTDKIIEPAAQAVDKLLDKLEKLIPGDWDKPLIDKLKEEFREELIKLLTE